MWKILAFYGGGNDLIQGNLRVGHMGTSENAKTPYRCTLVYCGLGKMLECGES